jgi:hypothetical protein
VPVIEPTEYAREILRVVDTVLPLLDLVLDDNDRLGEHSNSIVVNGPRRTEIPWTFSKKGGFFDWKGWDYTLRYLVSVT